MTPSPDVFPPFFSITHVVDNPPFISITTSTYHLSIVPTMKTGASNTGKHTGEVLAAEVGLGASKKHQSWKATLPRNLRAIVAMKNWVKQRLHGQDITVNVSLRVLRGALKMQEDYLLKLQKKSGDKNGVVKARPSIRKKSAVSSPFRSTDTVQYLGATLKTIPFIHLARLGREGGATAMPKTVEFRIQQP
jgi:hypothetical protein